MSDLMSDNLQISFLPWVEFKESVSIGPITFWPYYIEANKRVSDQEIKKHLDKYFKSYVDHKGKPVNKITVCSHGEADFRCLNSHENQDIRYAVDALIFATIAPIIKMAVCANNRSWAPPSSNVFELITQYFEPGSDDITVKVGSLTSGGWKIGEIAFPKPWTTIGVFASADKELIKGFDNCFSSRFSVDVRERLFRSLYWFWMAHIEGSHVSELSKIVMMTTAFEILLQFPRWNKSNYFMDYIERHIASDEFLKEERDTHKGEKCTHSLAGWWASDFYKLRNQIVHGDYIPPDNMIYNDWVTHLIVADLVFWECVKRKLFKYKCLDNNISSFAKEFEKMFPGEPQGTSIEILARWLLGFNDVHRALGWIRENRAGNSI